MDDQELIAAFEQGTIDSAEFPHERHVLVARGLWEQYGREEGLRRMTSGLRAITARAGRSEVYHETITRAWFELIADAEDLDSAPELFDKRLLGRYYSSARLRAGRERWLEPDLHPLQLAVPASSTDAHAPVRRNGAQ